MAHLSSDVMNMGAGGAQMRRRGFCRKLPTPPESTDTLGAATTAVTSSAHWRRSSSIVRSMGSSSQMSELAAEARTSPTSPQEVGECGLGKLWHDF